MHVNIIILYMYYSIPIRLELSLRYKVFFRFLVYFIFLAFRTAVV